MKLAFSGQGRYPDFEKGYALYVKRAKTDSYMDRKGYSRVIRAYCKELAGQLETNGMADIPGLGSLMVSVFRRRPQYRGKKFIGYGKIDWKTKEYDGSPKAFGVAFLPRHDRNQNLRCYGFVANRRLYQRLKEIYDGFDCPWTPLDFSNEMI